ncbi:glycosyltransferase family 2 protein [Nonlabens sp. Asnod2-A12]|uniref:glycosyltransferase family 2 protein n=1 Tax=Nonlabens sp. Asnod2-A12 TaxID=3160578 RepID=UPI003868DF5C
MNTTPLISIILPLYNGEEFLAQALDSCLNQTIENWELIIVNDYSTDQSLNIATKYQKLDNRIKIIQNEINKQLPYTLNKGFAIAKGDYVTWTSDDNVFKSNYLEVLLKSITQTESDFVFSNYDIVNQNNTLIKKQSVGVVRELLFQNIIGPSFLGKASLFKDNYYDVDLFRIEDYAFWLSNLTKLKCNKIEESVYKYRVHGSSLTTEISSSGGFKHDLIDNMFTKLQQTFSFNEVTKRFLVLNQLNKKEASDYFFKNHKGIIKDIFSVDQDCFQYNLAPVFNAHIKHYEKLLDLLVISKSFKVSFNILKKYEVSGSSLIWMFLYSLKRIKRIIV